MRLILALLILLPGITSAATFYDAPERGWYWYDENAKSESEETINPPVSLATARAQLEQLKQDLEDKKALAIMYPTEKNIKEYIQFQHAVTARSETFATEWKKVVIKNPELDFTVENPTNQVARRVFYDEKKVEQKASAKTFADKYGLFFFFKSTCPYCHKFAPILKMFEEEYGVTIIPVSLDGQGLPEYPNPRLNNGIAENLKIDIVPAVIAVDPKTGKVVPVSYGLITMDEMAYRLNLLTEDEAME
jgi:conjugal transfer pilus assembly protein TraF